METITQYLETMFRTLPVNTETIRLKEELRANMEDRFDELKTQGKTENEAVGTVITEFGNIDELVRELNLTGEEQPIQDDTLSLETIRGFIAYKNKTGKLVALGVFMILLGVALLLTTSHYWDGTALEDACVLPLLVLLIPAVALFIYSGTLEEPYKDILKGKFTLPDGLRILLTQEYQKCRSHEAKYVISSICLFVASPIVLISVSVLMGEYYEDFGVVAMLLLIAVGVFSLIRNTAVSDAYKRILRLDDYRPSEQKKGKLIGIVASIVWPITAAIYIGSGFIFGTFGTLWVLFPIVGILFGVFCAITSMVYEEK